MCSNFKKIQARNDSRFILHAMARFHSAYVPSHSFLESCGKAFPLFQKIQDYRLESTRGSDKPDDVSLVGAGWLEGFAGLHLHRPRLLFRAKPLSGPFWTKLRFGELHVLRDVLRFNFFFTFIVFFQSAPHVASLSLLKGDLASSSCSDCCGCSFPWLMSSLHWLS